MQAGYIVRIEMKSGTEMVTMTSRLLVCFFHNSVHVCCPNTVVLPLFIVVGVSVEVKEGEKIKNKK